VPASINTLPLDVRDFTGRDEIISRLTAMITGSSENGGYRIAIVGMGGVGKTRLAVHVAHQLTGCFPDAALYIDLRAHGGNKKPLSTYDAVEILLSGLGVPGDRIPESLEARISLWHRELASVDALIVLDNAVSADQVRDLLTAGPSCLFLITSRQRLFELEGVFAVPLDVLPPEEAATLFQRVLGTQRGADQASEITDVVRRLGYLPLAVRLAAALLQQHPSWVVRNLLELDVSQVITVERIYDLCYRDLGPREKRFFRLLAIHPGNEITAEAAAVLAATSRADAVHMLDALYYRHLIEELLPRRFKFHDLIKEFANREISHMGSNPEQRDGLLRLLEWYAFMAAAASESIGMQDLFTVTLPADGPGDDVPRDERSGLAWFDTELGNLLACANYASDKSLMPYAWQIPASMTYYLRLRGFLAQASTLLDSALVALMNHPDPIGEAVTRRFIGQIARLQDNYALSREQLTRSLQIATGIGDRDSLAWCHHELGHLERKLGQLERERNHLDQAGKHFDQARSHFTEARMVQRELQHPGTQAVAEIYLALTLREIGDPADTDATRRYLQEALRIVSGSANRRTEALALYQLGALERDTGDVNAARDMIKSALSIYEDTGNRQGQAECYLQLGKTERLADDYQAANRHLNEALRIYVELGYRRSEADTYVEFALTAGAAGNDEMSAMHREKAKSIYAEIG
jgi:tetratricopeptide (TPR) repeat protein